ncbi:hypothetical protein MFFC18_50450 [Mariniblastus fucicola]|uniref:Uncharacterized protein n=1 Tax=Mariniblastus fucicola TaxID=980251 RepID=A0A5B9PK76_9BACT|nr:hypothetical protein MFFC18_50450 [Mariniblastus fucicola]
MATHTSQPVDGDNMVFIQAPFDTPSRFGSGLWPWYNLWHFKLRLLRLGR